MKERFSHILILIDNGLGTFTSSGNVTTFCIREKTSPFLIRRNHYPLTRSTRHFSNTRNCTILRLVIRIILQTPSANICGPDGSQLFFKRTITRSSRFEKHFSMTYTQRRVHMFLALLKSLVNGSCEAQAQGVNNKLNPSLET